MAGVALVNPKIPFYDALGAPLVGGTLDVYLAGSTTRTNTWQDRAQTTLNTNPIVLDSRGECTLWADDSLTYKFVLKNSAGVTQWTADNISGATVSGTLVTFTQAGTGAVARTAQDKMREFVSILDFIPVAEHAAIKARTSTYDCDTALTNALAATDHNTIFFPAGKYRFANTINLKKAVIFYGEFGSQVPDHLAETTLVFPPEVVGVFVHRSTTNGDSTGVPSIVAASNEGATSVFRNIVFERDLAVATTATTTKHGMWLKGRATIENCGFYNFDGDGIHILAYAGTGVAATEGNANSWQIHNCFSYLNRGNGLYVEGSDANAGHCSSLDASLNSKYGVYDSSFLGNTYVGAHTAGNTLGGYKTANNANASVFYGCYAEGGQPGTDLQANTLAIGGNMGGAGYAVGNQGSVLGHTVNGAPFPGAMSYKSIGAWDGANVVTAMAGYDTAELPAHYFYHATYAPLAWKYMWRGGPDLWFGYGNSGNLQQRYLGPSTTQQLGRGVAQPYHLVLYATALGRYDDADARVISYGAAAPASGVHAQGEVVLNIAPAAGGRVGWVCTASGTPGTWKAFGPIDP